MLASQWVWQLTKSVSIPAEEQNAGRVVDYFYRMEFHITPRFFSDSNYLFFFFFFFFLQLTRWRGPGQTWRVRGNIFVAQIRSETPPDMFLILPLLCSATDTPIFCTSGNNHIPSHTDTVRVCWKQSIFSKKKKKKKKKKYFQKQYRNRKSRGDTEEKAKAGTTSHTLKGYRSKKQKQGLRAIL